METVQLQIEGMSCGGCVRRVEAALRKVDGIHIKAVAVGSATLDMDPHKATTTHVCSALSEAGFTAKIQSAHQH